MAGRPARHPAGDRYGYGNDRKPCADTSAGKKLQQLTKADGDGLVEWMLTEARDSPRHYRPGSLAARVVALSGGIPRASRRHGSGAAFPGADVHSCLCALLAAERSRVSPGVYAPAEAHRDRPAAADKAAAVSARSQCDRR